MPTPYVAVGALLVFLAACSPSPAPSSQTAAPRSADFDVLIAGGRILDGTGAPWYAGDVGIVGDRITAIGPLGSRTATTRIDAAGTYVAPGFAVLGVQDVTSIFTATFSLGRGAGGGVGLSR